MPDLTEKPAWGYLVHSRWLATPHKDESRVECEKRARSFLIAVARAASAHGMSVFAEGSYGRGGGYETSDSYTKEGENP